MSYSSSSITDSSEDSYRLSYIAMDTDLPGYDAMDTDLRFSDSANVKPSVGVNHLPARRHESTDETELPTAYKGPNQIYFKTV